MTTKEIIDLLAQNRIKEIRLLEKIQYWQGEKTKAEYYLAKYMQELEQEKRKNEGLLMDRETTKCPYCKKVFVGKRELRKHLAETS